MFVGIGTVINVIAIISGAALGVLLGNKMSEKTRSLAMDVLGAITLIAAAGAIKALWDQDLIQFLPDGAPLLVVLASLASWWPIWLISQDRRAFRSYGHWIKEAL
jgi:Uncharacterized membrane protein, possible Na+ channel or pump